MWVLDGAIKIPKEPSASIKPANQELDRHTLLVPRDRINPYGFLLNCSTLWLPTNLPFNK